MTFASLFGAKESNNGAWSANARRSYWFCRVQVWIIAIPFILPTNLSRRGKMVVTTERSHTLFPFFLARTIGRCRLHELQQWGHIANSTSRRSPTKPSSSSTRDHHQKITNTNKFQPWLLPHARPSAMHHAPMSTMQRDQFSYSGHDLSELCFVATSHWIICLCVSNALFSNVYAPACVSSSCVWQGKVLLHLTHCFLSFYQSTALFFAFANTGTLFLITQILSSCIYICVNVVPQRISSFYSSKDRITSVLNATKRLEV